MQKISFYLIILTVAIQSCKTVQPVTTTNNTDDGKLEAVFIQVNDVYEIGALNNGKIGGIARVAALKKQCQQKNANSFLVMAGDFLSPSIFNGLKYQGVAIRGKQMVECMNAAGFDLAVFGNHEFDIKEKELQDRINESGFQWVSSNCFHKVHNGDAAFQKTNDLGTRAIPSSYILTLKDADGTSARIGFFGLTLPFNKAEYVSYTDALTAAKKQYAELKSTCDAVIALTHQTIEQDEQLAEAIPGLAAIMGGHEHDFRFEKLGNINITKAHANAKSAFVITIAIDKKARTAIVNSRLQELNETIIPDSASNVVVKKWSDIADNNYNTLGFDSKHILLNAGEPLDGRESEVRNKATNLTQLIVAAMKDACPEADAAILNSGSIRVDDWLYAPIAESDIIRTLPFGGPVRELSMKGSLLLQILKAGQKNAGNGGFLQWDKINFDDSHKRWTINQQPVNPEGVYRIAVSDFLLSGKEVNLGFLNSTNPDIVKVYDLNASKIDARSDIRLAVVQYLMKKGQL